MDEARSEEATQSGQQQECILRGGVYLRHRLKKRAFQKNLLAPLFLHGYYNTTVRGVPVQAFRRAGVQETVPLFP